jgi:hypothetical protein
VAVGLDGAEAVLSDEDALGPVQLFEAFRAHLVADPDRVTMR